MEFGYFSRRLANCFAPFTFLMMIVSSISGRSSEPSRHDSLDGHHPHPPVIYYMPKDMALLVMAAIFCSANFGGAISAILINTPGTPSLRPRCSTATP